MQATAMRGGNRCGMVQQVQLLTTDPTLFLQNVVKLMRGLLQCMMRQVGANGSQTFLQVSSASRDTFPGAFGRFCVQRKRNSEQE